LRKDGKQVEADREVEKQKKYIDESDKLSEAFHGILSDPFTREEIIEAFNVFDIDGDGYINAQEIRAILSVLGEDPEDELIDMMIKMFDSSGDGQIKFDEFYYKITGRVFFVRF